MGAPTARCRRAGLDDSGPAAHTVDWVIVERLTGTLTGPITRRPSRAELVAARRAGASVTHLAALLGVRTGTVANLTDGWVNP